MASKAEGLIQMAMRAGKTIRGDGLLPAITSGKAKLVIYSSNCGDNRRNKLLNKCATAHIPCLEMPQEDFDRLSSKAMSSLGISDTGFARAIAAKLDQKPETQQQ